MDRKLGEGRRSSTFEKVRRLRKSLTANGKRGLGGCIFPGLTDHKYRSRELPNKTLEKKDSVGGAMTIGGATVWVRLVAGPGDGLPGV